MFSPILLLFVILVIMDVILNSIKEKQKIEMENAKRKKETRVNAPKDIRDFNTQENIEVDYGEEKELIDNDFWGKKPWEESISVDFENYDEKREVTLKTRTENKMKKTPKEQIKKDILKGIIFSQILQEPKSIRNRRKSM
ncbi:hypothetical protein EDD65_102118 [Keratinibaculum paraultunense]|uniref:Uncharacterized protein n=1 Tax=Keratinibaculum paraultunense TaxID=1278232 RepID=A0A4R3KZG6_9FIRM|nr:hypothetical protein [Keratinibaculum paraultunense]QQY80471.1 hypothetical protein JL105_03975 [Keratinibaculum paraultunense]TCS91189.1 hypothetical protein EDD65_102118 [Keratinibaculum paraultunense]